jgi:hypothetical protein
MKHNHPISGVVGTRYFRVRFQFNHFTLNTALLVKLWRFFECFPLLRVMTENHQPDMLPLDQIDQFNRTGADRFGVRVAVVVLLVTGKALAEGYSVNRQ